MARQDAGFLTQAEERWLLTAAKDGSNAARDMLREAFAPVLTATLRNCGQAFGSKKDAKQEGELILLECVNGFDLKRDGRFGGYLRSSVEHRAGEAVRKNQIIDRAERVSDTLADHISSGIDTSPADCDLPLEYREILAKLGRDETAFRLSAGIDGETLTEAEIAERLHITKSEAHRRIVRARDLLRELLDDGGDSPNWAA